MTHHSARAQWNTANARLANKPFNDLFAEKPAPGIEAQLVTALHDLARATDAYPPALFAARRAAFLAQIHERNSDPDAVDVDTPAVTDEQDERNSRPFPF